jgi:hypothetical protein
MRNGGEGGIRTHGTRKGTTVFETAPIDHSGTSPHERVWPAQGGRTIAMRAGSRKPGAHRGQRPVFSSFSGTWQSPRHLWHSCRI